jgi:M6 family metalloprotease-like protein
MSTIRHETDELPECAAGARCCHSGAPRGGFMAGLRARVTVVVLLGLAAALAGFAAKAAASAENVQPSLTAMGPHVMVGGTPPPRREPEAAVASDPCALVSGSGDPFNEGLAPDADLFLPARGAPVIRVIFVDFPDAPAQRSDAAGVLDDVLPRVVAWYAKASYGKLVPTFVGTATWFRMPRSSKSYGITRDVPLTFEKYHTYLQDAVSAADSWVDFSAADIVYVIPPKRAAIDYSPAFVAYSGSGLLADGVEIRHATTIGAEAATTSSRAVTLIHETGHMLGLPDTYDYRSPYWDLHRWVGGWDMMGYIWTGGDFVAWHKRRLGWLAGGKVVCLSGGQVDATLRPLARRQGKKAIVVPIDPSSAWVVEARDAIGVDTELCDPGVLVYVVYASKANGHGPLRVKPAARSADEDLYQACGGPLLSAAFDVGETERSSFVDRPTGFAMEILAAKSKGAFRVRVTKSVP